MQHKAVYLLFCKFTLHVSGVKHTHHKEYTKLQLQPPVLVIAAQKIWPVLEAVVKFLCTPDGECGRHPKHVEWTCRIINRLLCVASRWTVISYCRFVRCNVLVNFVVDLEVSARHECHHQEVQSAANVASSKWSVAYSVDKNTVTELDTH